MDDSDGSACLGRVLFCKTLLRLVLSGMTNNSLALGLSLTAETKGTLGEESARNVE